MKHIMRRLILLSVCLFIACNTVLARPGIGQTRLDSLLTEIPKVMDDSNSAMLLAAVAGEYQFINPDEGVKWGHNALALAQKNGWQKGMQLAYTALGNNYLQREDYAYAIDACFHALTIAEARQDHAAVAQLLGIAGMVYMGKSGPKNEALTYELKSLHMAEQLHARDCMAYALANIATIYVNTNKPAEALEYAQKALHIAEAERDERLIITITGDMGVVYANLHRLNQAMACYFRALRLAGLLGYKTAIARNTGNIGGTYLQIAKGDVAFQPDSLVSTSRQVNLSKSITYLRAAVPVAIGLHSMGRTQTYLGGLGNALALSGDYKGAFEVMVQERDIKDSIYHNTGMQAVAQLEAQRDLQLKEKDIELAKLAVAKKRNERVFYIAAITLLLIVIGIIGYSFRRNEHNRKRIKALQDARISLLDKAVKRRTEQLGAMRQTIATDFHDQTGNMLAAITRQAATLELKLLQQPEVLPMIRSIINNANELYASSKDFLWNLNHDSDDPLIVFQYLGGYGQRFYNQFDISFSALVSGEELPHMQLPSFAGLNLIYIFKEAMSNVIKHSGADEVDIELHWETKQVIYSLQDNGIWKEADSAVEHYGLKNIERRCRQSDFGYRLIHGIVGTRIEVSLPVSADFIKNSDEINAIHP